ncbi:bifunctional riboflavin kinase/FAD synthetase [Paraferrimonas sp. SM1919]|uniref:bifunctional riboflavin kinase/FAD synthetase n=1 Tax=Paraferrimonas sp. SM1919 TaxID=2662263 RepID=UPI0013D04D6E|nr:bifunctional riboflavin kinase/FAD synthetase [Paraferrimonas sp. SM1919]
MELIRGIHNIRARHFGCVLSIGNFDGVHQGHAAVLAQLKKVSKNMGLAATVMTFEPQPKEWFAKSAAPARLTSLREKIPLLAELGMERTLCVRFNKKFAEMTAEDFVEQLLVKQLGVKYLVVGDDFCFGKGREGSFDTLKRAGIKHGFEVVDTNSFKVSEDRVSSTLIRQALAQGNLVKAQQLLGHPYRLYGRVSHGEKIGRTLGFPTANIHLKRDIPPLLGIVAVKVSIEAGPWLNGVANIGTRPTVAGQQILLEAHIFDFNDNLYGKRICVEIVKKIRDEQPFGSLNELKIQITKDAKAARAYLEAL